MTGAEATFTLVACMKRQIPKEVAELRQIPFAELFLMFA